jgi:hypothetical protein
VRGSDCRSGELFSYVDLEVRVLRDHPLRAIRSIANEALATLGQDFATLYASIGRPSIAPEKLLRAMLLQAFYSIRSERQLMERLEYDLLRSRRTESGFWRVMLRLRFWLPSWRSLGSRGFSPVTTSQWMERLSRHGPR